MIREHLSVACDACVAELAEDARDDIAIDNVSFGYKPADLHPTPTYFTNHKELLVTITGAGWYLDANQVLCPRHYKALTQQ